MPDESPHILVVDDEPIMLEWIAAALDGFYVIHSAAAGAVACEVLRRHHIAGVILDAMLGTERGLDLVPQF